MSEFSIGILGSVWTVRLSDEKEEKRLEGAGGFTDWTCRLIVVGKMPENSNLGDPGVFQMKVLRHEIIHAYMFESGLGDDWEHQAIGQEETVVDWFAIQMIKIYHTVIDAQSKLSELIDREKGTDERD